MAETEDIAVIVEPSQREAPGRAMVEDKNRIDPSRRFNIAPVVNKILETKPQTADEVFGIIREAIKEENKSRIEQGLTPLGTEPKQVKGEEQDSDQQKIEMNCIISSILIPYYDVVSHTLGEIATSQESVVALNPLGETEIVVASNNVDLQELLEQQKQKLLANDKDYLVSHVFHAAEPGQYEYYKLQARGNEDERTVRTGSRFKYTSALAARMVMSETFNSLLDETIAGWESSTPDSDNPLATDTSLKARFDALSQSLPNSRNRDQIALSVFNGGFGVGQNIYEALYEYAQGKADATETDDTELKQTALALELAGLIGIPAKLANNHLHHFLNLMGKAQTELKNGNLLQRKETSKSYTLNPTNEVSRTVINLDDEDNIVTGCPAITQGIITQGFKDYVKLRVKFDQKFHN